MCTTNKLVSFDIITCSERDQDEHEGDDTETTYQHDKTF